MSFVNKKNKYSYDEIMMIILAFYEKQDKYGIIINNPHMMIEYMSIQLSINYATIQYIHNDAYVRGFLINKRL